MNTVGHPSEPNRSFLIREEDWGLVCIVPAENRDDLAFLFKQWQSAADKTKLIRFRSSVEGMSCVGSEQIQKLGQPLPNFETLAAQFTERPGTVPRFLILEEKVAIGGRDIAHTEVTELFGHLLPPADMVLTATPIRPRGRRCQNCFALGRTGGTALYGTHGYSGVTSLHLQHNPVQTLNRVSLAGTLALLGEKYQLILVDWANWKIVDLNDKKQIEEYLGRISPAKKRGCEI